MSVITFRNATLKNNLEKGNSFRADNPLFVDPSLFVSMSGGTEFTSGSFRIHRIDSSTNLNVYNGGNVQILVVAGGGGGGGSTAGAGGERFNLFFIL